MPCLTKYALQSTQNIETKMSSQTKTSASKRAFPCAGEHGSHHIYLPPSKVVTSSKAEAGPAPIWLNARTVTS